MSQQAPIKDNTQSIALVTFKPDKRVDTFDLLQSGADGKPIAKEPRHGVVDFYSRASDVPIDLPRAAERGTAPTFIVDVSRGGFARLEQQPGVAFPNIEISQDALVQQFVPGQPFSGQLTTLPSSSTTATTNTPTDNNAVDEANKNNDAWSGWLIALIVGLALLAIVAAIVAIVLAAQTMEKEKQTAARLALDEQQSSLMHNQ